MVLDGLNPKLVFEYFEQICAIPHGSGNEERISKFIAEFAVSRGLKYVRDSYNNVVIYADGTAGYEDHATVILQGHMDMVAEKEEGCPIDMTTEGLRLMIDGDWITADGTTLGGDDGIAVAFMLAILDDASIAHPPLECVFTTDEEVGMSGAAGLDMSVLKGRTMINLDSEDEGYLLVSCAGGIRVNSAFPVVRENFETRASYKVEITGLPGGHSGCDIHLNKPNADVELGKKLASLMEADPSLRICEIRGGTKDNVIPSSAYAIVVCDTEVGQAVGEVDSAFDSESTQRVIRALTELPNGVQRMSKDIEDLPELSLSLGVVDTVGDEVIMKRLIRSNVEQSKKDLANELAASTLILGGSVTFGGDYPGWEYRANSPLRDLMVEVFSEQYGREPVVQAIHAGVECGMFDIGLNGLDAVSIGPDMQDIHSPRERLSISSTTRVWNYVLEVLKRL